MKNINIISYFNLEPDKPDLPVDVRNLYRTLYGSLSYLPGLSLFITLGFIVLYLLGLTGLLDKAEPKLLIVAGIAFVAALLHVPLFQMMRKGELERVAVLLVVINGTAALAQIFLWQGIIWFPLTVTVIPYFIFTTQPGIKIRSKLLMIALGLTSMLIIYFSDQWVPYDRMLVGTSLTMMAALSIYLMVVIAMAVLVLLHSQITFKTISARLATTFTFIALLSSVATLLIAALANLYYDRQKIFLELNAVSIVRADQVGVALDNLGRDVNRAFSDPDINQLTQTMLNVPAESTTYKDAFDKISKYLIQQQRLNSKYQEVLLIDSQGKAVFSTTSKNINQNFFSFTFFENTGMGINYSVESNFPASFDRASILLVKPFFSGGHLQYFYAVRVNFDSIKQILSANTGIGYTAETYLVGFGKGQLMPFTNTRNFVDTLNTHPAEQSLIFHSDKGSGIWDNYTGASVLGSYVRIPSLRAVLISEIEQSEVTKKTIDITMTNAIIGIFTLLLAFTIVVITSRSIALPIVDMAQKASNLANGQLSTRIQLSRQDEIGTLAQSFNSMASELETLVRTLEDKVEDRTRELRKQTNYLRIAAEVARDATTSENLDELLNRAAQLILDRFNFYHTGIFLLDEQKEYAILRASPTQAGQEMLARNHALKVGQVGIVGNVAATGMSRIALDTGKDVAFFNNPLLPNTRSEMALPLKVGNELIGVLDVQSNQPQAFSQDDIGILQIMADQLALAIQRVQLAQEQVNNMHQLESAYQRFTFESWKKFSQKTEFKPGYSYDGMHLVPLNSMPVEARETLANGQSIVLPSDKNEVQSTTLAVPIKLRDQVIGIMTIVFNSKYVSPEAISLAEETAALLATSLENARLYTATQKAAIRERTVSEITSKIRSTNDPKEMVQIALNELKQTLHLNDARVVDYNPPNKPGKV